MKAMCQYELSCGHTVTAESRLVNECGQTTVYCETCDEYGRVESIDGAWLEHEPVPNTPHNRWLDSWEPNPKGER